MVVPKGKREARISSKHVKAQNQAIKLGYQEHASGKDGNTVEFAHWVGKDKVWLRFKVLLDVGALEGRRILDFGCGNGLLLDYIEEKGVKCHYHGWDISRRMVETARKRHPLADFKVVDILEDDLKKFQGFFDYVLVSGVFHVRFSSGEAAHLEWIEAALSKLWPLCKEGLGFNLMSEHVDWKASDLYYAPIDEITKFLVENCSRWFLLRHDYPLWEYTVYVYKNSVK
ncbi:MAG: class I SAM-dependent methyltransferase [Thaumarchaeota archaeon]|nr:class I SAM-dependent methyltransferase [Nitrososphaerota archaeon]